jgi:hypothetical protein
VNHLLGREHVAQIDGVMLAAGRARHEHADVLQEIEFDRIGGC